MTARVRFNWLRIAGAVLAAEALPIAALVGIVFVYGLIRPAGSASPEQFAPTAGRWVGPIGGFLATFWFALRLAARSPNRPMAHGVAVGVGTALLDLLLSQVLGGSGPIEPLLFLSNGGRLCAGVLGGWLDARRKTDSAGATP